MEQYNNNTCVPVHAPNIYDLVCIVASGTMDVPEKKHYNYT
jgi:hypothetical protein